MKLSQTWLYVPMYIRDSSLKTVWLICFTFCRRLICLSYSLLSTLSTAILCSSAFKDRASFVHGLDRCSLSICFFYLQNQIRVGQNNGANIRGNMLIWTTIIWLHCWIFVSKCINVRNIRINQPVKYMIVDLTSSHVSFVSLHCIDLHGGRGFLRHAPWRVNIFVVFRIIVITHMICFNGSLAFIFLMIVSNSTSR